MAHAQNVRLWVGESLFIVNECSGDITPVSLARRVGRALVNCCNQAITLIDLTRNDPYTPTIANACFAAATVFVTSSAVCAVPRNAASYCDGGR